MHIAANTKIATILKEKPEAIEAIAAINKHFEKLRNPLLRKILASRVTIADAAKIGGCRIEDFYERLAPLGFEQSAEPVAVAVKTEAAENPERPPFLVALPESRIISLDVSEDIATGNDPFLKIMDAVEQLDEQKALRLLNTFEPTPLIAILQNKGYASYTETKGPELVHTYFWLGAARSEEPAAESPKQETSFEELLDAFKGITRRVDVREMEMPQPMVTILHEMEQLPQEQALYVIHRRVPQFLLPRLAERGYKLALKEAGPDEVYLLIYKELP
ncbi:uncharacterized protein DUF1858 [Pontibacter ummariensis]|uniref:DUF2249 domain-containing protein n=1 Tax=Pontibacter ummariensis TaxID=1610492 RepID=A0A239LTI7_9BACT|nr:DUF2249 domain-containing protein [Pontibacter ummariensis]PRY01224.1 uncharacterized protein DUF1858 [Pontibacter ummariensis]SNT33188.1 protein of unknown function [Pontibacter ummariensis]